MTPVETIDTPTETITIETRLTGDGKGEARTVTVVPKPGTRAANENTVRDRMASAQAANAAYLGLTTPTAAQQRTQLDRLTRQVNALLKLALDDLDDAGGT